MLLSKLELNNNYYFEKTFTTNFGLENIVYFLSKLTGSNDEFGYALNDICSNLTIRRLSKDEDKGDDYNPEIGQAPRGPPNKRQQDGI